MKFTIVKYSKKIVKRSTSTLKNLKSRGLISQISNEDTFQEHLRQTQIVYTGFDPTAKSLHAGNLLAIISLLHFGIGGHKAIALVGGATGTIGDPSGKISEREMLDKRELDENVESITNQLHHLFTNVCKYAEKRGFLTKHPVKIVNNREWFQNMKVLDFIGFVGRYARINSMVFDS